MNDTDLMRALRAANAAEVAKAPKQHRLRTPQCPPLTRFVVAVREGWTPEERDHVTGCAYCQQIIEMEQRLSREEGMEKTSPLARACPLRRAAMELWLSFLHAFKEVLYDTRAELFRAWKTDPDLTDYHKLVLLPGVASRLGLSLDSPWYYFDYLLCKRGPGNIQLPQIVIEWENRSERAHEEVGKPRPAHQVAVGRW